MNRYTADNHAVIDADGKQWTTLTFHPMPVPNGVSSELGNPVRYSGEQWAIGKPGKLIVTVDKFHEHRAETTRIFELESKVLELSREADSASRLLLICAEEILNGSHGELNITELRAWVKAYRDRSAL